MSNDTDNDFGLPSDVERLVALEVALRNSSAPWHAAAEVIGRLADIRQYESQARPLRYALGQCSLEVLITGLAALRSLLGGEAMRSVARLEALEKPEPPSTESRG